MKSQKRALINYKSYISALLVFAIACILTPQQAYSQIDYTYGHNYTGFRLSAGANFAASQTHFSENPIILGFVGNLDYNFNPYFSIGGEGQVGSLQGIDKLNHLQYSSSTNSFITANLNFKVALGAISDFDSADGLHDAIKNLYAGVGVGLIKNDISLTNGTNSSQPYGDPHLVDKYWVFPFNFGTNIDILRGVTGSDRFAINPNFQFSIIHSPYADGFQSDPRYSQSTVGYYGAFSIKLKYKF